MLRPLAYLRGEHKVALLVNLGLRLGIFGLFFHLLGQPFVLLLLLDLNNFFALGLEFAYLPCFDLFDRRLLGLSVLVEAHFDSSLFVGN